LTNTAGVNVARPFDLQNDATGPGGLLNALTYNLLSPSGLIVGDVLLTESAGGAGPVITSDLIRFNATEPAPGGGSSETLVFYSDITDGVDSLADIGLPGAFYRNVLTIAEIGPEGLNGVFYTPTAGQPGFVDGGPVTYHIISDASVPEPTTLALLGSGLIGLAMMRRRKLGATSSPSA
jgi:hypothetical protein